MSSVYGPEDTITHKLRDIFMSRFVHSDLVLLCSDDSQVLVHQAIMANLSPLIKEVLMNHNLLERSRCAFIFLDQDSDSVRKMINVLYSGKTLLNNQKDVEKIKELLNLLGIDICLETSAISTNGWMANDSDFIFDEHIAMSDETQNIADDDEIPHVSQVPQGVPPVDQVRNILKHSLTTTMKTSQYDNKRQTVRRVEKRKHEDSGKNGQNNNKVAKLLNKNNHFLCPVCSESFKVEGKLIKHQVDEHYYEDLENLLVEEYIESKVCCKVNFANTGFGMFIRHKAAKHGALQLVSFKTKQVCTSNDNRKDHVVDVAVSGNLNPVSEAASEQVQTKTYFCVKPFASRLVSFENIVVSSPHKYSNSNVISAL